MTNKIQEFYDYLKKTKGLSDTSIYHYLTYHRYFMHWEVTQESINKFVQSKNNNSVVRGYMRAYLEFLGKEKEFELPKTKSGSTKKKLIRPVSKVEINRMRDYAYLTKKRDGILFDLLYYGALRRAEIPTIKVSSFAWGKWFEDPEQFCELRVVGKRNKERKVLVPPKTIKELLSIYYDKRILTPFMQPSDIIEKLNSMNDPLFKKMTKWMVWRVVKKYSIKALNRDIRTHEIRHARASEMEERGVPIKDIQVYLGHQSVSTTEIYLHSSEERSIKRIKEYEKKEENM